MALINTGFVKEDANEIGGVQRIYKFASGWGLSLINSPMAHSYPFAWEAAVLNPNGRLDYSTELTSDVVVFDSDEEANEFISRAYMLFTFDDRYSRR